jgi:hypothetical protein
MFNLGHGYTLIPLTNEIFVISKTDKEDELSSLVSLIGALGFR